MFMCLSTDQLKFLDVTNYIAPGFSYEKYLKVYGCEVTKGHFPYEYMDCLERLDYTTVPPKEALFSRLKNEGISDEDYASCEKAWRENGITILVYPTRLSLLVHQPRCASVRSGHSQTICLLRTAWHRYVQARDQRTRSDFVLPVQ